MGQAVTLFLLIVTIPVAVIVGIMALRGGWRQNFSPAMLSTFDLLLTDDQKHAIEHRMEAQDDEGATGEDKDPVVVSLPNLLMQIKALPRPSGSLLVGIDGCGGSGKSTLARRLAELDAAISVVHMDDFYKPSGDRDPASTEVGANFDWRRVRDQVLLPLSRNQPGRYQRYDWETDQLAEWHDVPANSIVLVEGCYSLRRELTGFHNLRVWMETPRDLRLQRGLDRDGEESRPLCEQEWMPAEDRYVAEHRPNRSAELVVDGTGSLADLGREEIGVIRAPQGWLA